MSGTVDERIVEMEFQSSDFISNVSKTVTALAQLKSSLNFSGAADSLNNLDSAGKKFSLAGIGSAADSVASKFSALGLIGIGVLANLASKAVDAGLSLAKSLTIQPILDGLTNYETKINAIETITANTGGASSLSQITSALANLNTYSNLTVFNFADMAKNIGTFTAAGVGLQTSVDSIKGIANLAALSGSSAEQASTGMYQLSQAIAAGSVKLQDWNSVVNAGFGGKVFQTALENTARASGVAIDQIIAKAGSFRNSLQQGWLTSNILTETLSQFTGDLSTKQIEAMGFTAQEAAAIESQAKTAVNAATQIRTITQLMAALHDDVGTAWAGVWEALLGNISQVTPLLTGINNELDNIFVTPVQDFAKFLQQWSDLGGRAQVIQGLTNVFHGLGDIIGVIEQAFHDIFPPVTLSDALAMSAAFEHLTITLTPSKKTLEDIQGIFIDLFSAVKIVVDVIGDVASGFSGVGTAAAKGGSSILGVIGYLLNYVNALLQVIEGNAKFQDVLQDVGKVLAEPFKLLGDLPALFTGLGDVVGAVVAKVAPWMSELGTEFGKLGSAIAQSISSGSFSNVLNVLNQGIFATILLAVKKFISSLGEGKTSTGFLDTIKESFEGLTGALQAMQTNLKSGTLEKIAIAVALLTVSLVALSLLNVPNLTRGLAAITGEFTDLIVSLAVISKISGNAGIVKLPIIAAALILLSGAILILTGAVVILGHLTWTEITKGLSAIALLLGELVGTVALLSKNTSGLYATAVGMEVISVAINILADAVEKLGKMPVAVLAKGVGTIAALLLIIAGFNAISAGGAEIITTAVAMVIVAGAINILATAIGTLGSMSIEELAKGLVAMGVALLIMAGALALMDGSLPGAAALVVASAAIVILSNALISLSGLSWQDLAVALVALAGSLTIIALALIFMEGSLPGSAALLVAAGALAVLAPVILALSTLSWSGLAVSMVALAGAFVIIGAAGLLLTPLIPSLLGLGAAIALLGVGILAAGLGIAAFGVGITALAISGGAAFAVLVTGIEELLGVVPSIVTAFGKALTQVAGVIITAAPAIIQAFLVVTIGLLNAVIILTPKIAQAATVLITGILNVMSENAPRIVSVMTTLMINILNAMAAKTPAVTAAGVNLIVAILNGISANLNKIVVAAGNLAITFINAVGTESLKVTQAGATMIINFVNGLATQIRGDTPAMTAAGLNLANAIISGMTGGLLGGSGTIESAAKSVASVALSAAKAVLGIKSPSTRFDQEVGQMSSIGIANGMLKMADTVEAASTSVAQTAIEALKTGLSSVDQLVSDSVNLTPTITPVIDLTQAQAGFSTLSSLTKAQLISANASAVKATSISAGNAIAAVTQSSAPGALTFTQNNYSPTALSSADIYRQTKNQLSVVKEALPSLCLPR